METCKFAGYALAIPGKPTAGSKRRLFRVFSRHELGLAWVAIFGIPLPLQLKCPGKNKKVFVPWNSSSCLDAWDHSGLGFADVYTGLNN